MSLHELTTVLAGFLATAFAILRLTVLQHKAFTDRMLRFFEDALDRQVAVTEGFRTSVQDLALGVRENTLLVRQVAEWLQVSTPVGRA